MSVKTEDRAIINILTFPFEIMRVWTAFIDKIKQKLNSKYLDSVIEELAIRLEKLQHPQQILKRRRNLYYITKSMNLPSGRTYPSFCIAGNCQSRPLVTWLKLNFPFCSIKRLAPYQEITRQSQIDEWIEEAVTADFVMMIPVSDSYGGFKFGSNYVRSLLNEKTKYISYPSYYLEVFYPFFGYAKNAAGANILGSEIREFRHPYGDYHDFLAMVLSTRSKDAQARFYEKVREIDNSKSFNSTTIINLAIQSFYEFEKRYPSYINLIKSDIINGVAHTFNHPTGNVLNKIYKQIWTRELGLKMSDFLDFNQDPLRKTKLPIPSFVSIAILSEIINAPWRKSRDMDFSFAHNMSNQYILSTKRCIQLYRSNPDIIECNEVHEKFQSSESFLHELGI